MVGKGDVKGSRIFHQCYLKCCKLQNLTPLNNVLPSANGKVLDFCVDRIKYADWPPILNALSCDLSLHSVSIKCRQHVKTVLEQIDCERLAKTVNKRSVILTNFMLNNLMEAISQLLTNTTLLSSLLLEGLPLKIPYLNPLCNALSTNTSLQHLYLPRCLVGDAGCLAICKAVRSLPNILTLDLGGCELTPLGAGYIADLVKYQKIHRYSENWIHTLRYQLPNLDTMAGLRRISLCGNPQLGDAGAAKLLEVLADDLWIKAVDLQNCGVSEEGGAAALRALRSNTTLVVLDLRHNPLVPSDCLATIRAALRRNERGPVEQYSWLGNVSSGSSDGRPVKTIITKNGIIKDRVASSVRNAPNKYTMKSNIVKKEKDYAEVLEEQLREEISHRQQLEELNLQLVEQMKGLKRQQTQLWANNVADYSGSEQSLADSSVSGGRASSAGSASSVPIDHTTLAYIQQAFRDIYAFIKNNQCQGQCGHENKKEADYEEPHEPAKMVAFETTEVNEMRVNITPKRVQSSHVKLTENVKKNKTTKSAHLLGDMHVREDTKPDMIERQMGDVKNAHGDEILLEDIITARCESKKQWAAAGSEAGSGSVSDSSDTLVPPAPHSAPHPAAALFSSDEEDDDDP